WVAFTPMAEAVVRLHGDAAAKFLHSHVAGPRAVVEIARIGWRNRHWQGSAHRVAQIDKPPMRTGQRERELVSGCFVGLIDNSIWKRRGQIIPPKVAAVAVRAAERNVESDAVSQSI